MCIEVEGLLPAVVADEWASAPASPGTVAQDLELLLHPRGPLELSGFSAALLQHRIASEAFVCKHSGSFGARLEEASWLPRPVSLPHPDEEAWREAQRQEAAAHLAHLRRIWGDDNVGDD